MRLVLFWLESERERWVLWLPVALMAGMLLYFALPAEPRPQHLLPLLGLPVIARFLWRRSRAFGWIGLGLSLMGAGFLWAKIYTDAQAVTILQRETRIVPVEGRIVEIGDIPAGLRIVLDSVRIEGLTPDETPQRIRVTLRGWDEPLLTGERIALRAGLLPPAGPVMPGGFDFARYFFFRGIGAVGYAIPPVTKTDATAQQAMDWQLDMTAFRQRLSERIRAQMSAPEGAVAAALMTGDRAAIPEDVNEAMRDTNLSHILSISGMHMAIIGGLVFVGLRLLLLLLPPTRHWRNHKKIAAACALLVAAGYLAISGFPVSAVRAFVMLALMLLAVLIDREVTPMRSLMLAALLILAYNPSSPLDPGFQLSFIATAALIAWYEQVRREADEAAAGEHYLKRALIYAGGIMLTSLIAELPTNFFVIYHFNSFSSYGMIANLFATPLVSFLIMPGIILAFLGMPFGLDYWPLQAVEVGIAGLIAIAETVASFPYAQFFLPSFPGWGMAAIAFGLLWVILWRAKARWLGIGIVATGCVSWLAQDFPDLLVTKDMKQIAGRVEGELVMLRGRAHAFAPQQWANGSGMERLRYYKDLPSPQGWRCDALGCVYRSGPVVVAMAMEHEALVKDCVKADLVFAPFYIDDCQARTLDRGDLTRDGAHWLWIEKDAFRVESTADRQGSRPWNQ